MIDRSRVVVAALALTVASVAICCGTPFGSQDGGTEPASSEADAATSNDSATPIDAGAEDTSTPDTSMAPDAAPGLITTPGGDLTTLPCGGATCAIPAQSCCAYGATAQAGIYYGECAATCAPPSGTTNRLAILKCSGPANCPSSAPRCCYSVTSGSTETSCQTSCTASDVTLCDPGVASSCGAGRTCVHFTGATMPPKWGYCQ